MFYPNHTEVEDKKFTVLERGTVGETVLTSTSLYHTIFQGELTPEMIRCYELLNMTSRSFAAVIQALDDELRPAVCIFYLVLRGLDTIGTWINIYICIQMAVASRVVYHACLCVLVYGRWARFCTQFIVVCVTCIYDGVDICLIYTSTYTYIVSIRVCTYMPLYVVGFNNLQAEFACSDLHTDLCFGLFCRLPNRGRYDSSART